MPSPIVPHPEEACAARRLEGRKAFLQQARMPLAVYIHWPFCRSKCPYCDFNSHVRDRIDEERWTRALLADLERQAELAPGHEIVSIFFGGGTPSLMPPDTVAALIERVKALWPVAADLEVTLEANPNSAEAERFAGFGTARAWGTVPRMKQSVSLITLGVSDYAAAKSFYEALGWSVALDIEETAFFQANGVVLVLWARAKLSADTVR